MGSYDKNTVEVLMIRIRDPVPLDSRRVKYQDPDPGSGINIPKHISEGLEKQILGKKYLNSMMRIRDPECFHPGSRMEKFGSGINIPDPLHWLTHEYKKRILSFGLGKLREMGGLWIRVRMKGYQG